MSRADLALKRRKGSATFLAAAKKRLLAHLATLPPGRVLHSSEVPAAAQVSAASVAQLRNELLEAGLILNRSLREPLGAFEIAISENGRRAMDWLS